MEQFSIFDFTREELHIDKPIRLIELFAGYGSQAMALENLGADFEHYLAVEFDKYAIASYNAVHGTNFPVMDICDLRGSDLKIVDTDKYCYIMTYSFPCTDLSIAGKMMGMEEGSGTRSSLLWEVKRLLDETENLPQILLMENVPAIHSDVNMPHFQKWIDFLSGKGYVSYWDDLNAKNYGVAQNRDRTFCISILGEYNYKFPNPIPLRYIMKDYLEDEVDEKYYINSEKAENLIQKLLDNGTIEQNALTDRQTDRQTDRISSSSTQTELYLESMSLKKLPIDLYVNKPSESFISNPIMSRQDRGISNRKSMGSGIVETVHMTKNTIRGQTDMATTLLARDYKGFGNRQSGNGIIERQ